MERPSEPSSFRLVATLSVAGLFAGLLLVGVFLATHPQIEHNRSVALRAASIRVLFGHRKSLAGPGEIVTQVVRDGVLVATEEVGPDEEPVYVGYDADGSMAGYAIPAEGAGFQDTIKLIYAFDVARRRITGMEVLEHRETPGLGDRIEDDPAFVAYFRNLAVNPSIEAVKPGEGDEENEVECITGATISSNAIVRILNESVQTWQPVLRAEDEGAEE